MFFQEQEVKKKKKTGKRKSMCQGTKELLKRVIKRNPRITDAQQLWKAVSLN